ncbi:MAG: AraC family transcriptional regulator [Dehalococcoidales bacterium]|nr:AraC family transcriptional regulator [Dehalococcoidales bacterium]
MEWPERFNAAIEHIEQHLEDEIDYNAAAKIACFSLFHFQRIFHVVNGMTLADYVRRRRMTLAARDLSYGNAKIIDIALKYGYDSPDAFSRAFRRVNGVTPQAAREPGVTLVAYPRISFQIVLKGGDNMDYRIVEKPAFEVVCRSRRFTTINGENFIKVPQFWDEFCEDRKGNEALMAYSGCKPGQVTGGVELGICWIPEDAVTREEFTYGIGVEKEQGPVPAGFETKDIPAATWAVFSAKGSLRPSPAAIQDVTKRIFSEWFPSTGFEHAPQPELEVYLPGDITSPDYVTQIWIPIITKKKQE